MLRRKTRRDANHKFIKEAFERLGCWVGDLSLAGDGWPDLLVACKGTGQMHQMLLVEVKTSDGEPNEKQKKFYAKCPFPISIVRDLEGVLTIVKAMRA